jgi:hypothetical protein
LQDGEHTPVEQEVDPLALVHVVPQAPQLVVLA